MIAAGTRVRLVRFDGTAGDLLAPFKGEIGTVVEVYERAGKPVLRVAFAGWGRGDGGTFSIKPQEVEVVE